ncbi:hypothetical protein DPMN_124164 [Dreissena polymorpha]|uniref:Uncharacterized protein n=1 Tax=Dreissena polymorpha TaxID=45954 RepID=A0A9D4GVV7_DREPO|nr:hypothetical protein DPMN_124164 [Dreissena polymorpha]
MMTALRNLSKQGIRLAELDHDSVVTEFQRLLKDLPVCPQPTGQCNANANFRTIYGTCNNLDNPAWGMAGAAQRRLLPAA